MVSRNATVLVSLFAYIIVSLGCPISLQPPGKAAKRALFAMKSTASSSFKGGKSLHDERATEPPSAPRSRSPVMGFMISDQPRVQTDFVEIPRLIETFAVVPIAAYRLSEINRSPDTPPPRSFTS